MSATIATRPHRHPAVDHGDRGRTWLARLFAGDFSFPAVPLCPLPAGDRTAAEHAAAARAAGCRDLFVVHADPVAGERVIADIARATADRVLVLSPHPGAADRVAERLLRCGVPVLRALADDENPVRPSPQVSKITSAAVLSARAGQARQEAAADVAAAEQRLAAFAVVAKAVARLTEVTARLEQLDAALAEHAARRDRAEADVAAEVAGRHVTAFGELVGRQKAEHDTALAGLIERRIAARKAADEKGAEVETLNQQHLALTQKSGFFGRLFGKPKVGLDADDVKQHLQTAEAELADLTAVANARQAELESLTAALAAEREKLIAAEVAARRGAGESALAAAEDERARARAEAAALNAVISAAVPGEDHAAAERQLAAARERAAAAAQAAATASAALTEYRVVVGTPGCLGTDPVFAAPPDDPMFGVLVLDRAEELPEPEFPRLARFAERWVLVGEALPRDERPTPNAAPRTGRAGRPAEPPFVFRLAQQLDREAWAPEGDRLVCRLGHLTPDQRRGMGREPLADRPEIELRFATTDGEPLLAEIAFPSATAVSAAKTFLFRELNEVLLRPCGEPVWVHAADAITARWPAADGPNGVWIDLEPGVREKVTGAGPFAFTAAVSFDPVAGWNAETAAAWLLKHVPPSASRFAVLPRAAGPRPGG